MVTTEAVVVVTYFIVCVSEDVTIEVEAHDVLQDEVVVTKVYVVEP